MVLTCLQTIISFVPIVPSVAGELHSIETARFASDGNTIEFPASHHCQEPKFVNVSPKLEGGAQAVFRPRNMWFEKVKSISVLLAITILLAKSCAGNSSRRGSSLQHHDSCRPLQYDQRNLRSDYVTQNTVA